MTLDEAKAIHAAYQRRQSNGSAHEYMAYMRAKGVLADAGLLTLTAGQRGFIAAARKPLEVSDE